MAAGSANSWTQRWDRAGGDVGKDARHACAHGRRAGRALNLSVLRGRLRPTHLSQRRKADFDRRRSGKPDQSGKSLSKRRRLLSVAHAFAARNENEVSRAARETVDGNFARSSDGYGGGSHLGIAQAYIRQVRRSESVRWRTNGRIEYQSHH